MTEFCLTTFFLTETDECRRLLAGLESNIYQLIAVNEKPEGKQYCCKECGKEALMFALPKGHKYSRRKSLSFADNKGFRSQFPIQTF